MTHFITRTASFVLVSLLLLACEKQSSIYQQLALDEDGVIVVEVPDQTPVTLKMESQAQKDQLSLEEKQLVDQWHDGEEGKLSFVVIDIESQKVVKSYFAKTPQRLASVTKIPTALGALENIANFELSRVQNMLKISNNGEASRQVRLAARAIDSSVVSKEPYSQKHSCPAGFLEDEKAAVTVFNWLKNELSMVDWTGASLFDGAGCHYDNFMTPLQVTKILQYADLQKEAYEGLSFEELLAISGIDGTLKNKNIDHRGYILAKTGTLRPNANLSGYFYAKRDGDFKKYYFAIFVNKKGGGIYSTRARRLIEGLMRYWINYYSLYQGPFLSDF